MDELPQLLQGVRFGLKIRGMPLIPVEIAGPALPHNDIHKQVINLIGSASQSFQSPQNLESAVTQSF